jgi:hypothetical protein
MLFGAAMAVLAHRIFDLAAARLSPHDFARTVRWVLSWMFGNAAIVMGGTFVANLTAALQGMPWGTAVVLLSYLAGFGSGIVLGAVGPSRDRSLIGKLRTFLSGCIGSARTGTLPSREYRGFRDDTV